MSTSVQVRRAVRTSAAPRRVAIAGFGTVGQAVAKIISERYTADLELTHVYNRDVERKRVDWLAPAVQWTESIDDVLAADVDVLVEVAGGLEPAGSWVRAALESGKSVVTANKQLIAHRGPELLELARKNGQEILYGASVAGGVPVLSGIQHGLAGDTLIRIGGILNGTCNYILSQIEHQGSTFDDALAEAQRLGFAEADPTEDVDGYDARAKLTILSRIAFGANLMPEQIACRSIRRIDQLDFHYAKQLNCTIRQISRAQLSGPRTGNSELPAGAAQGSSSSTGSYELHASADPALVALDSPLAGVHGGQNLVVATGVSGGDIVFSGAGAGGNPTAVAVVSDLLALRAHPTPHVAPANPALVWRVSADFTTPHYVRITIADRPGILAAIAEVFGDHGINIDCVLQKPGFPRSAMPFVVMLEACSSALVEDAVREIAAFGFNAQPPLVLPVLK